MKTISYFALTLLGVLTAKLPVQAERISEPGTIFYGRVISRVGDREFPITTGELKWTISVPAQNNYEYTLTTTLQPVGDGLFSYKLTVPHQALAYDLTVAPSNLPLTAAGWRMRHLKVLVNGEEALLAAPATDDFTASQSARASTYRIDLILNQSSLDSDGDGLPDWWEDQNGTDKWNPNDQNASSETGNNNLTTEFTGRTFTEWRQYFFPGATGDLTSFGQEDTDGDGVVNLLEYAFELNPKAAEQSAGRLPHARLSNGRMGIVFARRTAATDLIYQVQMSGDLLQWKTDDTLLEQVELPENKSAPGLTCVCLRASANETSIQFLRVRVGLKP